MDYKVYATNHINGMIDFDYSEEEMKLSLALDTDSEIIEEYNIASDQSFLISANNLVVV